MRSVLLLALFLLSLCPRLPAEEISLSLDEAINLALRENRSILLQAEEVKRTQAKIAEAKGGFLPSVTATATEAQTKGYFDKDIAQTTAQATVKQYLYKGGKTIGTYRQNQALLDAAQAALETTHAEVILEVKKAFYSLLLANEFTELNTMILDNTQKHLDYLEALYRNGQTSELELLKIKESLSSVEEAYEASRNQAEALQTLLCGLLFIDEKIMIVPDAELTYEPRTLAYEEGFLRAMEKRPELKEFNALEKADRQAAEIAKADTRPSIYASWDYYARSHASASAAKNWNDYQVIGVTVSWPVFDGWATKAKVEQAIIDLKQTQLSREKFIKDMAVELKTAYLDFKDSINQLKSSEADIAYYTNHYASVQEKYTAGLLSALDLDDAAVSRQVALFNKKQAVYNFIIAQSAFEKAIGG